MQKAIVLLCFGHRSAIQSTCKSSLKKPLPLFFRAGAPTIGAVAALGKPLWRRKNPGCNKKQLFHELADDRRMDETMLTEQEIANARTTLNELQVEHRDLNLIVEHLTATPLPQQDQLLIQRLKKRKLALKDKIYQLEKTLVPDIPA